MNKDELKAIYFSFFDQLKPEHAEKAKANYDEDFRHGEEPFSHKQAIDAGFNWNDSPEGEDFWCKIHSDLARAEYPLQLTPEVLKDKAKAHMGAERPATGEDYVKLEDVVKGIKATVIHEPPSTEPNFGTEEDILEEALRITGGDRMSDYGPPDQDFRRTAIMWEQLLNCRIVDGVLNIQPKDVAMCMIALKLSRETHQSKRDNFVDIAGYARCGALCEEVASNV